LVIAGDGPERTALESKAAVLGISERVHFLGSVRNVLSLYSQVDAVVLPSRAGAEGLPNVLLEALRADVPVVATAVAAVPEVLSDPSAGELVEPGNVDALVRGIEAALTGGRFPAASAARAAATARFSLQRRMAEHLSLYAEVRPDRVEGQPSTAGSIPVPSP
jgi:glycosyltransferase involved in cell wall biosynthesis